MKKFAEWLVINYAPSFNTDFTKVNHWFNNDLTDNKKYSIDEILIEAKKQNIIKVH